MMIVPLEDDLVNISQFWRLFCVVFLKIIEIAFFKILSNLNISSFKYDTYLQYQLNITQKIERKTFQIVYWSQNVVINNYEVVLLEYKRTIIHQIVMQVSDYIYLQSPIKN